MSDASAPALILAIDGGQSASTAVLASSDGALIGVAHGGPIVDVDTRSNSSVMRAAFRAMIPELLSGLPTSSEELALAYLSLTGGADHAPGAIREIVPCREIVIESDVFAVLAAATKAGPGIGLIAGTGSIAGSVSDEGTRTIQGGWGFLLGDEGSGFWIGREAIEAAIAAEEGRGSETVLREIVLRHFGAGDLRSTAAQIYDRLDRVEIAALAEATIHAADRDPVAADISARAGQLLADLVVSLAAAAIPRSSLERRIAPGGGVLQPGNAVWSAMAARLTETLPDYELLAPKHPPVVGSLMLALHEFHGESAEPALRRLETHLLNPALSLGKSATSR
jgi:N-acetylglucosamine kinase-like BadF-type ATPase